METENPYRPRPLEESSSREKAKGCFPDLLSVLAVWAITFYFMFYVDADGGSGMMYAAGIVAVMSFALSFVMAFFTVLAAHWISTRTVLLRSWKGFGKYIILFLLTVIDVIFIYLFM